MTNNTQFGPKCRLSNNVLLLVLYYSGIMLKDNSVYTDEVRFFSFCT